MADLNAAQLRFPVIHVRAAPQTFERRVSSNSISLDQHNQHEDHYMKKIFLFCRSVSIKRNK
jgi:hypothetical protein